MVLLVMERRKHSKKKKTDRIKSLKSEEKEQGVYTIKFYLQFLCVAGYLKHNSDTPKLSIHKYTNYNIIEIYINRLSTTTQIFIAMDYLIMMSEK